MIGSLAIIERIVYLSVSVTFDCDEVNFSNVQDLVSRTSHGADSTKVRLGSVTQHGTIQIIPRTFKFMALPQLLPYLEIYAWMSRASG
jgi:hypothetical protein